MLATNMWVLVCHALNFLLFTWYIERVSFLGAINPTSKRWAGLLCGALFAFSGYRLDRHMHLQLMPQFWTPLALLTLDRAAVAPRPTLFLALGAVLAAQWLAGTNLGMIALILTTLASLYYLRRAGNRRQLLAGSAAAAACVALFLSPLLIRSVAAVTAGLRFETRFILEEAPGFLAVARAATWDRAAAKIGVPSAPQFHQALFPGIVVLALLSAALASLALRPRRRDHAWACAATAIVFLYLAVGHEPALRALPLFAAVRRPGRFALGALVPALVLFADSICVMLRTRSVRMAVVLMLSVLLWETSLREVITGSYLAGPDTGFEEVLARSMHRPVLLLPQSVGEPNNAERARLSLVQMGLLSWSWVPGLAGRSGPRPPFVGAVTGHSLAMLDSSFLAASFVDRARRLGFAAIAVMPDSQALQYVARLSGVLGEPGAVGGCYSYFPLFADPEDAPGAEHLDFGKNLRRMMSLGSFSVHLRRVGDDTVAVRILPHRHPLGVVQRAEVITIPYEIVDDTVGGRSRGSLRLVLDAVSDRPDLTAFLRLSSRTACGLIIAGRRYEVPVLGADQRADSPGRPAPT